MSRPIASVPSGYAHDPPACHAGGFRKTALLVRSGGYGASAGAKIAVSMIAITNTRPATAPWFALKYPQNSRRGWAGADATTGTEMAGVLIFRLRRFPDPWIDTP
jgi:hypothetical protein